MASKDKEPSLYLLVNQDLKMSKGKIGAQCGHAVQEIVERAMKAIYSPGRRRPPFCLDTYHRWSEDGSRKIVLKGPQALLEECASDRDAVEVHDAGRTEVAPDSLTVVAWFPITDGKTRFKGYSLL